MREILIERYLRDNVTRIGGRAVKWVAPGYRGVPDRIVLLPNGRVAFVELKAPGKKPNKLQDQWLRRLRDLGHYACFIDSKEGVDRFIAEVMPE